MATAFGQVVYIFLSSVMKTLHLHCCYFLSKTHHFCLKTLLRVLSGKAYEFNLNKCLD